MCLFSIYLLMKPPLGMYRFTQRASVAHHSKGFGVYTHVSTDEVWLIDRRGGYGEMPSRDPLRSCAQANAATHTTYEPCSRQRRHPLIVHYPTKSLPGWPRHDKVCPARGPGHTLGPAASIHQPYQCPTPIPTPSQGEGGPRRGDEAR